MAITDPPDVDLFANMLLAATNVSDALIEHTTPEELVLGESLLTPGLNTVLKVHSYPHFLPTKNLDEWKKAELLVEIERPILPRLGIKDTMSVRQKVYRVDRRRPFAQSSEEYYIHACDQSLLNDAVSRVSKSWKCERPSEVVRDVLTRCAGVNPARLEIEGTTNKRPYIAENVHPFQVVAQQATAALAGPNDPSYVHYMTYKNEGTHHFKSLYSLTKNNPKMEFYFHETGNVAGGGYANPWDIMGYEFPCDFDLLSDLLNGVGPDGNLLTNTATFNVAKKKFNLFGNIAPVGCGIGQGVVRAQPTNEGSEEEQATCPDQSKHYAHLRQARMGLLDQDKIALRLTVPWNPTLHVGDVIRINLTNKGTKNNDLLYGSGDYPILHSKHYIKRGGYATLTLDCVSTTTGDGIV